MGMVLWKSCLVIMCAVTSCYSRDYREYFKERTFHCEPILEEHCAGLGYNYTTMPNIMGDENQKEASRRFLEFKPLLHYRYSEKFHFFLCTLFFPMCTDKVNVGIPACRPMCEEMRREKGPIMKTLGFEWSDSIECNKLPWKSEEDHLCIPHPSYDSNHEKKDVKEDQEDSVKHPSINNPKTSPKSDIFTSEEKDSSNTNDEKIFPKNQMPSLSDPINPSIYGMPDEPLENPYPEDKFYDEAEDEEENNDEYRFKIPEPPDDIPPSLESKTTPPLTFAPKCPNPEKFVFVEKTGHCTPRCDSNVDVLFSSKDKHNAFLVLTICALLCFVSTAITIATFFIDSQRFRYPERPVMFLSLCYNVYSAGYLMRSLKGIDSPLACLYNSSMDVNHLITSGHKETSCYASFFILYFFGMAASVWWVLLNVTFLLSAGFKWGHEAIERFGIYFHFLAWTIPLLQTIAVLLLAKIDGNELTGLCYVGNMDSDALMYFVIIPLTFYLLIGSMTLVVGISYLFKILRVMKHQNIEEASNLEKLIKKISIFSMFYAIPAACVLASNFYQYQHFSQWLNEAQNTPCFPQNVHHHYFGSSNQRYYYNQQHQSNDPQFLQPWSISNSNRGMDTKTELAVHASSQYNSDHFIRKRTIYAESQNKINNVNVPVDCLLQDSTALYLVYFFKISMSLLPGLMCGIWIGNAKTFESWSKFFNSCKCRKRRKEHCDQMDEDQTLYPRCKEMLGSSLDDTENTLKMFSTEKESRLLMGFAPTCHASKRVHHLIQTQSDGKQFSKISQNFFCFPENRSQEFSGAQAIAFLPRHLYDRNQANLRTGEYSDDVFIRNYDAMAGSQSNRDFQSRLFLGADESMKRSRQYPRKHSNNRSDHVNSIELGHSSCVVNVDIVNPHNTRSLQPSRIQEI